ncbi:MAG: 16S rRNA (cytosine(1402)-N(4))-methyltransferase RsmH [Granulosicoccus sp.]
MSGSSWQGSVSEERHVPVLLHTAVKAVLQVPNGRYVDATYGRGGHSAAMLDAIGASGKLLAIDRDPEAVGDARQRFGNESRFEIAHANFGELGAVLNSRDWNGAVNGMLADLGVSSPQLDVAERGFGFSRDGSLDMRMDPDSGVSAAEWLAQVEERELANVLKTYGEERYARRIAKAIVAARDAAPLLRTGQLAEIIKVAHPRWQRHHHPATRSFQAIRIAVNREFEALDALLKQAEQALCIGGRIAIISFHSLEDRIVKRALRIPPPDPSIPRHLPQPLRAPHPWKTLGKAIKPSPLEIENNPRSRSAVLRVAERVA